MSTSSTPATQAFVQFAVDRAALEFEQLSRTWDQTDLKAQANATIAGVFLAAAFAFVTGDSAPDTIIEKVSVGATIILLVLAIGFAASAMFLRRAYLPLTGRQAAEMVQQVLERPESEFPERFQGLLVAQLNHATAANRDLRKELEAKALRLSLAQVTLVGSAAAVVVSALCVLAK
jgi:hypothetical protein